MFGHWLELGDGHTYPDGGQKEAPLCFYFGKCPMFQKNWCWANQSSF
jgi:hypothetical protein